MFALALDTENAAFESPEIEIARILRAIADRVESPGDHFAGYYGSCLVPVADANGNTCGQWVYTLPREEREGHGMTPAQVASETRAHAKALAAYTGDDSRQLAAAVSAMLKTCLANPTEARLNSHLSAADLADSIRTAIQTLDSI